MCGLTGVLLPVLFILSFVVNTFTREELDALVGEGLATALFLSTVCSFLSFHPMLSRPYVTVLPPVLMSADDNKLQNQLSAVASKC